MANENYNKKNSQEQLRKLKKTKSKKRKKSAAGTVIKVLLLLILVVAIGVTSFVVLYVKKTIEELPDITTVNISPTGYMSTVYDRDGNKIETLASSGANRSYVTLDQIPLNLQHAFVAIEDERFYEHNGIDLKGIVRAGLHGISSGFHFDQGASTITQQLLKNNYFTTWTEEKDGSMQKVNRKIQEQFFALELEKFTSKSEILENYLNTINLGQNTLGVEAASERYFNKKVSELTLSECSVIAGITQNPSRYNPITHPENNQERRKKTLDNMLSQGYITNAEYNEAMDDDVYSRISTVNVEKAASDISTTYFVDALTDEIVKDLMTTYDYDESQAYRILYAGGLSIYSTQNTGYQKIVDEEVNNLDNYNNLEKISFSYRLTVTKADGTYKNYSDVTMLTYYQAANKNYSLLFSSEEEAREAIENYKAAIMEPGDTVAEGGETITFTVQPQVAMTVMDHTTGEVVALTGGRGSKKASKTLNRATGITRQPGSTFKVVAAYAPALDAGGKTIASVEDDAPYAYLNGTPLSNYDNVYGGFTNFRQAITHSTNVVTVKALTEVGTGLGFQYVKNFGITTLVDGDNNQALALGGITNGVTNLELTGAYATIANSGDYIEPHFYTKVLDHNGYTILDKSVVASKEVLKDTTAYILTSAMMDVMTHGTGTAANFSGMPVAGKSGTTTKNRDTVFAGFTPYYTTVVWGGFDDNTPQNYTKYSKQIWKAVMQRIHADLPAKTFTPPENMTTAVVCRKSGKLAVAGLCDCDPRGSQVYTEIFEKGTEPVNFCDIHARVSLCASTGMLARSGCPVGASGVFIRGALAGSADSLVCVPEMTLASPCTQHGGDYTIYLPLTGVQQAGDSKETQLNIDTQGQIVNPNVGVEGDDTNYSEETAVSPDQGLITVPNAIPTPGVPDPSIIAPDTTNPATGITDPAVPGTGNGGTVGTGTITDPNTIPGGDNTTGTMR